MKKHFRAINPRMYFYGPVAVRSEGLTIEESGKAINKIKNTQALIQLTAAVVVAAAIFEVARRIDK